MKPLRPRYRVIDREVDDLLARAGVSSPPIPVEIIAEILGAVVVYKDFKDEVSGLLIRHEGTSVIGVHKKQGIPRRRFTIAHEIGHLVMHDGANPEPVHIDRHFEVQRSRVYWRGKSSSTAEDVAEIEANAFAASLLMPRDMVRADVEGQTLDFEDSRLIKQLADKYEVSAQAMTFRLLSLFPHHSPMYF